MHPSAYTQRQNAAYARIQAAEAHLASQLGWPPDTLRMSGVYHPDANLRALLKLEAAADLVVHVAQESGYEELAPEPFAPNEFIVPPDQAVPVAPIDETAAGGSARKTARKNASKTAAKTASKSAGRR